MNPLILQRTGHATPDASAPANGGAAPSAQAFEQILAALNAGGSAAQQHGAQGPTLALPATDQPRNPASGAPSLNEVEFDVQAADAPVQRSGGSDAKRAKDLPAGPGPVPTPGGMPYRLANPPRIVLHGMDAPPASSPEGAPTKSEQPATPSAHVSEIRKADSSSSSSAPKRGDTAHKAAAAQVERPASGENSTPPSVTATERANASRANASRTTPTSNLPNRTQPSLSGGMNSSVNQHPQTAPPTDAKADVRFSSKAQSPGTGENVGSSAASKAAASESPSAGDAKSKYVASRSADAETASRPREGQPKPDRVNAPSPKASPRTSSSPPARPPAAPSSAAQTPIASQAPAEGSLQQGPNRVVDAPDQSKAVSEATPRSPATSVKAQRNGGPSALNTASKVFSEGAATQASSGQGAGDAQADTQDRKQRQSADHRQRGTTTPAPQRARTDNNAPATSAAAFEKTAAMEQALDPKPTATGASSDTEASPERILSGTSDSGASSANTSRTKAPQSTPAFTRPERALAWLQARGAAPRSTMGRARDGWRTVEMQLKDGDGSLTIKTKQDDDRMAVSVGFTDSRLRSLASANAQQIQNVLQSQYNTTVDLSLMSGGHDSAEDGRSGGSSRNDSSAHPAETDADASDATTSRAPLLDGEYEWVG